MVGLGVFRTEQIDPSAMQLASEFGARGSAINMAATLAIDAVIDPADTRDWVQKGLHGQPARTSASHLAIDSW